LLIEFRLRRNVNVVVALGGSFASLSVAGFAIGVSSVVLRRSAAQRCRAAGSGWV